MLCPLASPAARMAERVRNVFRALCLVSLVACSRSRGEAGKELPAPRAARVETTPNVRWFGALRAIMHEGRTEGVVRLSQQLLGAHAFGLGALAGLHGELTLL